MLAVGYHRTFGLDAILVQHRLGQPLAPDVGLDPEVGEEHKEEGTVDPDEVDKERDLVVTLLHEVVLGDVNGHQYKLDLVWREVQVFHTSEAKPAWRSPQVWAKG